MLRMLRYYGSDAPCLAFILAAMPEHETYVEPFGGGALVLLNKPPARYEYYNDADLYIANLFICVRDELGLFLQELSGLLWHEGLYGYLYRRYVEERVPVAPPDPRAAAEYYALVSMSRDGAVAAGSFAWRRGRVCPNWMFRRDFGEISARLRGVTIFSRDGLRVAGYFLDDPDAFLYLDPPHPGAAQGYRKGCGWEVVSRFLSAAEGCRARWLMRLSDVGGVARLLRDRGLCVKRYVYRSMSGRVLKRYVFAANYEVPEPGELRNAPWWRVQRVLWAAVEALLGSAESGRYTVTSSRVLDVACLPPKPMFYSAVAELLRPGCVVADSRGRRWRLIQVEKKPNGKKRMYVFERLA